MKEEMRGKISCILTFPPSFFSSTVMLAVLAPGLPQHCVVLMPPKPGVKSAFLPHILLLLVLCPVMQNQWNVLFLFHFSLSNFPLFLVFYFKKNLIGLNTVILKFGISFTVFVKIVFSQTIILVLYRNFHSYFKYNFSWIKKAHVLLDLESGISPHRFISSHLWLT